MTNVSATISNKQSIYAALELSKNSWLLAIQVPGRDNPSLHPIKGGDAEGLMAKLDAARQRVAKDAGQTPAVTLCYEAGYDGFWLARFKGLGPALSSTLTREVYYRQFSNRRQLASYIGIAPSAYDSGEGHRSQGISKAGNRLARVAMVEAAWLWLRHQPDSALSQWFHDRTQGQKGRIRRIMIVALARKLAIALWRYLETGLIPEGASLKSRVR
jgi:transposase